MRKECLQQRLSDNYATFMYIVYILFSRGYNNNRILRFTNNVNFLRNGNNCSR